MFLQTTDVYDGPIDAHTLFFQSLHEVTPIISAAEQLELFLRWRDHDDVDAYQRLSEGIMRLAYTEVNKLGEAMSLDPLDRYQVAFLAVLEGIRAYEPEKGAKVSTYACTKIRGEIQAFKRDSTGPVKHGTARWERKIAANFTAGQDWLRELGREVNAESLAEIFEVKVSEVHKFFALRNTLFLDQKIAGKDTTFGELITDTHDMSPVNLAIRRQKIQLVLDISLEYAAHLEQTNERRWKIWTRRMTSPDPESLQSLADDLGISRERVRQVEALIKEDFLKFSRERGYEAHVH